MYAVKKPLAAALALFFAVGIFMCVVSVFGINHSMETMGATTCSYMLTVPGCEVAIDHLISWQASFAAILLELLSFLFLVAVVQTLLRYLPRYLSTWGEGPPGGNSQQKYRRILPRHTLQQAFANGIIHSRAH